MATTNNSKATEVEQEVNMLLPFEKIGLDATTAKPGDKVTWLHCSQGGYGFLDLVPAIVVRVTPTGRVRIRVRIRVKLNGEVVERTVAAMSLQPSGKDG